jgi:hypothetical protein
MERRVQNVEQLFPKVSNTYDVRVTTILNLWLAEVGIQFSLGESTVALSLRILNDYLSVKSPPRDDIQGYGVACLLVADDLNEIENQSPELYAEVTDSTYTVEQIEEFRVDIVQTLDGKIRPVTPLDVFEENEKHAQNVCLILFCTRSKYFLLDVLRLTELCRETADFLEGKVEIKETTKEIVSVLHSLKASQLYSEILKQEFEQTLDLVSDKPEFRPVELRTSGSLSSPSWFHRRDCEEEDDVGWGTTGSVRKVDCDGKTLALKRQKTNYASLNELSILSTYKHENLISVELKTMSIFGIDLYLEYGTVLSELIPSNPRLWREIYIDGNIEYEVEFQDYILDICDGVNYLHSHGIIHRDLKPQNIIVVDGRAKIADFGLSIQGIMKDNDTTAKLPEVITVPYRPPELLSGENYNYSFEVDVWSLACVILETITGEVAFRGWTEEMVEGAIKKVFSVSRPLFCVADSVVRNVLLDMLKTNPKERISASEAYERFLIHF